MKWLYALALFGPPILAGILGGSFASSPLVAQASSTRAQVKQRQHIPPCTALDSVEGHAASRVVAVLASADALLEPFGRGGRHA